MKTIRSLAAIAIACLASQAAAQQALEIISLKHRTVEQVLPVLRPLLEPGATLSGQSNQLIVRTSPDNLADLRRVLEAIDRPARRLQISVRFDEAREAATEGIGASGRIGNRNARIDVRAQDARSEAQERVDQRVQVLEGGRAFIATGQSRLVPQRQLIQTPGGVVSQQTFVVQDVVSGFEVVPRLSGTTVFLDLVAQRAKPEGTQAIQSAQASSTVSARLGEWVEVGGAATVGSREDRAIGSASRSSSTDSRRVWLKVEEIAN